MVTGIRNKYNTAQFAKKQEKIISKPFYICKYRFMLKLKLFGKADRNGVKAKYIGLYVCLVGGIYDWQLAWPMRKDVSLALVNMKGHEEKITLTDLPNKFFKKPYSFNHINEAYGLDNFLHHRDLRLFYLKNNQIVVKMELT